MPVRATVRRSTAAIASAVALGTGCGDSRLDDQGRAAVAPLVQRTREVAREYVRQGGALEVTGTSRLDVLDAQARNLLLEREADAIRRDLAGVVLAGNARCVGATVRTTLQALGGLWADERAFVGAQQEAAAQPVQIGAPADATSPAMRVMLERHARVGQALRSAQASLDTLWAYTRGWEITPDTARVVLVDSTAGPGGYIAPPGGVPKCSPEAVR